MFVRPRSIVPPHFGQLVVIPRIIRTGAVSPFTTSPVEHSTQLGGWPTLLPIEVPQMRLPRPSRFSEGRVSRTSKAVCFFSDRLACVHGSSREYTERTGASAPAVEIPSL